MNKFIKNVALFSLLFLALLTVGFFLPTTPRASKSLIFGRIAKDSLLKNVKEPRLIIVGGSSIAMSLNSKLIQDSLHVYPINTGIHANEGLFYMLSNTIQYIKKGDIVVVASEYQHFYGDFAYGGDELLHSVVDLKPMRIHKLSLKQLNNIYQYIPKLAISRLKFSEYSNKRDNDFYAIESFNQYGDSYKHWDVENNNQLTFGDLDEGLNVELIDSLKAFRSKVEKVGGIMFIAFPPYQNDSYNNAIKKIQVIENQYRTNNFNVLGSALQYKMPNEAFFDSPYHLKKEGVDKRTQMLIKDLKNNPEFIKFNGK